MTTLSAHTMIVLPVAFHVSQLRSTNLRDSGAASIDLIQAPPDSELDSGESGSDEAGFLSLLAIAAPNSTVPQPADEPATLVTQLSEDVDLSDEIPVVPPFPIAAQANPWLSPIGQSSTSATGTANTLPVASAPTLSAPTAPRQTLAAAGLVAAETLKDVNQSGRSRIDADGAPVKAERIEHPWEVSVLPPPSTAASHAVPDVAAVNAAARSDGSATITELPASATDQSDVVMTSTSKEHIEVSLQTPEMGQIWLEVKEVDQRIEARLETRNEITMKILQTVLDEIRDRVESIGVELDGMSLGYRRGGDGEQPTAWKEGTWQTLQHLRKRPTHPQYSRPASHRTVNWRGQINVLA